MLAARVLHSDVGQVPRDLELLIMFRDVDMHLWCQYNRSLSRSRRDSAKRAIRIRRRQSIPEIMAQPQGRARTIAKLSNYLVTTFNNRADSHGIIVVVVIEGQLFLLPFLGQVDDLESARREVAWCGQRHLAGLLL
jgi:hypothetical protein